MTDRELMELIAAKVGGLETDVGGLKADVGGLKADVGGLKADVGGLKADVGGLKTDVGGLKTDVGGLKTSMEVLEKTTNKTALMIENEIKPKIQALFDGYIQNSDKLERIEKEVSRQEEVILRKVK